MLCVASAIDCPSPIIGTQHWLAATVENRGFGVPEILIPHLVRPARLLSISAPDRAGLIDMSLLILPLRRGMRLAWQLVNENASLLAAMCVGWPVPTNSPPNAPAKPRTWIWVPSDGRRFGGDSAALRGSPGHRSNASEGKKPCCSPLSVESIRR